MISNTTISAKYMVTAGVLQFSIPFRIYKTTDVSVFWSADGKSDTNLTLGTDYSVSIGSEGGTVTLVAGKVPVGSILAIEPNFTATQETDLSSTTAISTTALETQLDKQTQLILQVERRTSRAVILPATSSESPQEVVQSIYASRDAAAASASEASAQATAAEGSAQASATSASNSHDSALAAAQSAADAAAASGGLAPRMDAVEAKNATQDTRLTNVEAKNTTQDNSIAANTAALATKTNTDMSNLTTAGKQATVGLLKKKAAIALSFPWGGGNLSALPADGWLTFKVTGGSVDTSIEMDVGGPGHSTRGSTAITTVELTVWAFKGSTPYFNASPWGGQTFSMTLYTVEGS